MISLFPRSTSGRFISGVAALLALALPSGATAGSQYNGNYGWGVGSSECVRDGGKFGAGYIGIRATNRELGKSGVNYMKIDFDRQYYGGYGPQTRSLAHAASSWTSDRWHTAESVHWADDEVSNLFSRRWRFPLTQDEFGQSFRMKVTFKWYDAIFGPDIRKHKEVVYGPTCSPGTIGYG